MLLSSLFLFFKNFILEDPCTSLVLVVKVSACFRFRNTMTLWSLTSWPPSSIIFESESCSSSTRDCVWSLDMPGVSDYDMPVTQMRFLFVWLCSKGSGAALCFVDPCLIGWLFWSNYMNCFYMWAWSSVYTSSSSSCSLLMLSLSESSNRSISRWPLHPEKK